MVSEIKFDPESGDFTINEDVNSVQRIAHRLANHGKPYYGTAPYWGEDRHVYLGGDEINGDHLGIDFQPVNYTPTADAVYSDYPKHLSAHLNGIDDRFASSGHFVTIHVDPSITTQITGKLYNNLPDAVDYVNAQAGSSPRTVIQLMPGTYTLSSSVLNITEDCLIRGSGVSQTILDFTVLPLGGDYAIDFTNTAFAGVEDLSMYVDSPLLGGVRFTMSSTVQYLSMRNVTLVKTNANETTGAYAVKVDLSGVLTPKTQIVLRDIYIDCAGSYWQYGMQLLSGSAAFEEAFSVSNVHFEQVYTTALALDGWSGSVHNIRCHNCGRDPTPFAGAFPVISIANSPRVILSEIRGDKDGGGVATTGYSFVGIATSDGAIIEGLTATGTATNAWHYAIMVESRTLISGVDINQSYSGGPSYGVYFTTGSDDSSMNNFDIRGFSQNLYIDTLIDFITVANGVCRNRVQTKGADCRFNSVHFEDTLSLGESGLGSDYRVNNSLNGCHFSGSVSGHQGRATFSGCHLEPNSVQSVWFRSTMTNAILTGCSFRSVAASGGPPTPINSVASMVYFECPGSVVGCIQYDNPVISQPTWAYIRFAAGAEGVISNNTFMLINGAASRQGAFIDVSATADENVAIANNVCDATAGVAIGTNGIVVSGTANTVVTITGNIMPTITVNAPVPANRSNNIPAP